MVSRDGSKGKESSSRQKGCIIRSGSLGAGETDMNRFSSHPIYEKRNKTPASGTPCAWRAGSFFIWSLIRRGGVPLRAAAFIVPGGERVASTLRIRVLLCPVVKSVLSQVVQLWLISGIEVELPAGDCKKAGFVSLRSTKNNKIYYCPVYRIDLRTTRTLRHPRMANTDSKPGAFMPPGTVETVAAAPVVNVTVGEDFCRRNEVIPVSAVGGGTISLSQQDWS